MNEVTSNATEYLMPPSWATTLLVSGTFLAVICPLTVLSNFLLLIAIYKDPYKTFRTPSAYFLVGLAFVDLITGLIPEPMTITCYYRFYNNHPDSHFLKILEVAGTVTAITTNTSFFLVSAFTFAQYAALAFPFKFKRLITVRNTIACVVGLLLYAILFETLQLVAGVPREVIAKIDLHLHSTFSLFLTLIIYLMLQRAFGKQQLKKRHLMLKAVPRNIATSEGTLETRETFTPSERPTRQKLIEKNFVRLNLAMIIILLVCSQPSAIVWYVYLYSGEKTKVSLSLRIAGVVTNNTLFLKSLLDPFVFAWRLPKYRKALKNLFGREG